MAVVRMQRETYDKLREHRKQLKYRLPLSDLVTKAVELYLYSEGMQEDEE